jgi:hypothetical protein
MTTLTRQQFVDICLNAILKTRKNIAIVNQIGGYQKYHKEIKENNFFDSTVRQLLKSTRSNQHTLRHDIIEHAGIGRCQELAEYLLVEIARELKKQDVHAVLEIVASKKIDHLYLEIKITLREENSCSRWEVDAWDPRIIDISSRPDGSIKNEELLDYGFDIQSINYLDTSEFSEQPEDDSVNALYLLSMRKPLPGRPERCATPEREMLEAHPNLYKNYEIVKAQQYKLLPKIGFLRSPQKASTWQQVTDEKSAPDASSTDTMDAYCL